MAEEKLNLIQRLAKIRRIVDVAVKNKKGFNYTYSDISQILAKVQGGQDKYHVSLQSRIVPGTSDVHQIVSVNTKADKAGNTYDQTTTEMLFKADMIFTWICDDDPSDFIEVPWTVVGAQSDPSQAFGSGMTYCTRYFLTNFFQIPQVSAQDVDAYRSQKKEAESAEDKAIAQGIIEEFDVILKTYLADHQDQSEEIQKFLKRFVKNANYFTIKEPVLAAKLLNDFKSTYLKGE